MAWGGATWGVEEGGGSGITMPPPVVGPERQQKGATDEDVYLTCSLLKCLMLFFSSLIHHRKSTPQYPPHNGGGFTNGSTHKTGSSNVRRTHKAVLGLLSTTEMVPKSRIRSHTRIGITSLISTSNLHVYIVTTRTTVR